MPSARVFKVADHLHANDGEPIRSVVHETADAIVAWTVNPGQRISAHVHPSGQDTWTILSGAGEYRLDVEGTTVRIAAGDVVVAPTGAVHARVRGVRRAGVGQPSTIAGAPDCQLGAAGVLVNRRRESSCSDRQRP